MIKSIENLVTYGVDYIFVDSLIALNFALCHFLAFIMGFGVAVVVAVLTVKVFATTSSILFVKCFVRSY